MHRILLASLALISVHLNRTSQPNSPSMGSSTTTQEQHAEEPISILATTTTTSTTSTTVPPQTEPNAWPMAWLATLRDPKDSYWDAVAQCETGGDWKNLGMWGGGLGIYVPTWRAFGGRQFAGRPQGATREEQILVANRIALHGFLRQDGIFQQPVGFLGWGCISSHKYLRPTVPTTWQAWRNK
jgi:hypothetical protein